MSVPTDPAAELPAPPPAISFSLLRHAVGAPFLYAIVFPLAALDVLVSLYQAVCFRLWRLPRVARRGHFKMDRHKLSYLTPLQRLNCMYCSYANGVLAFTTEVASRTEQYLVPDSARDDASRSAQTLRRLHRLWRPARAEGALAAIAGGSRQARRMKQA